MTMSNRNTKFNGLQGKMEQMNVIIITIVIKIIINTKMNIKK